MKKTLAALLALIPLVGSANADLIFGGDFQLYKPDTDPKYTVPGELDDPGPFTSYAQGVGDAVSIAGSGIVNFSDGTSGGSADLPGWSLAPGKMGNPDTGRNGIGGSAGLNIFADWGGQQRVQSDPVETVAAGSTYTITAQIDGAGGGPMDGPLAFDLMANGISLTADAPIPAFTATPGTFQTITRIYSDVVLPDGVNSGDDLTIILGVEDTNTLANRMIWDDVTFDMEGGSALGFVITQIEYDSETSIVKLTWTSRPGAAYVVWASRDMTEWNVELDDGYPAEEESETTTAEFDLSDVGLAGDARVFFQVEKA